MKLIKLISLIFLILISTGCSEFLDRPDLDDITSDSYWKTPNDLNLYLIQYYSSFPGWSPGAWNGGIYWTDSNSDNLIHYNSNSRLRGENTVTSGNNSWNFSRLRSVNIFLEEYKTVEGDAGLIDQYVGEAYFFRAWYHFSLLKNYGDIPYMESTITPESEELYGNRVPRNEVGNRILSDLDQAISKLKSGQQSGGNRLSKECAMLFKARVALYEGTWEKYHNGTPFGTTSDGSTFIQLAADAAKNLMDNPGGYGIHSTGNPDTDYWDLFNQTSYAGHTEVMLWRDFSIEQGVTHNGQRYLPRIGGGRGLTKNLVDDYLCIDGKPIAVSDMYAGDKTLLEVTENRDPRLSQSVFLPGDIMNIETGQAFEKPPLDSDGESLCPTGYMIYKGANPDPVHYVSSARGTTSSPIFRFAEALLIYAEAKAELGTITQTDLDISINLLRNRVNMAPLEMASIVTDPNWLFPDLSPILNEVRRERRVEFALEGYRWDDLTRWQADELIVGKRYKGAYFSQDEWPDLTVGADVLIDGENYIDPHQNQVPNGFNFNPDRDWLLPVPPDEITLNPNLSQNPGW